MGSKSFQFKQFSVVQNHSAHKVGTDGVLLGCWVRIGATDRQILDIGTGSGLIALMAAQRSSGGTIIDAVEIESLDAQQAAENVIRSPWPEKIRIHHAPVQQFFPEKLYDLIVTNPPYFENSLLSPEKKRSRARHTLQLTFEELLGAVSRLLSTRGRLAIILPNAGGLRFIDLARAWGLIPIRQASFRARIHKPVERLLLEFAYEGDQQPETHITLYAEGETWSEEYQALTREFYIREA